MYYPRIEKGRDKPIAGGVQPDAGYCCQCGGPELTPDRPAPAAINPAATIGRPIQRPAVHAANDAKLFAGACDRCGQLYLQSQFPDDCLCPTCSLGGWRPDQRARPPKRIPALPVGDAP
jgi:hypothetical protein